MWSERSRIKWAVKRDEVLYDPAEALKIVEAAGRLRRRRRPRNGLKVLVAVALIGGIGVIVSEAWAFVDRRRSFERWERAEARHLEYLERLGLAVRRRPAD